MVVDKMLYTNAQNKTPKSESALNKRMSDDWQTINVL